MYEHLLQLYRVLLLRSFDWFNFRFLSDKNKYFRLWNQVPIIDCTFVSSVVIRKHRIKNSVQKFSIHFYSMSFTPWVIIYDSLYYFYIPRGWILLVEPKLTILIFDYHGTWTVNRVHFNNSIFKLGSILHTLDYIQSVVNIVQSI